MALLTSGGNATFSTAESKFLRSCGKRATQLAEAGFDKGSSATSKVLPAATIDALNKQREAERSRTAMQKGYSREEDVALLEMNASGLPVSKTRAMRPSRDAPHAHDASAWSISSKALPGARCAAAWSGSDQAGGCPSLAWGVRQ